MAWITAVQAAYSEEFPTIEDRISIVKSAISKVNISTDQISAVLSTGIDVYIQPSDSIAIACSIGAIHALATSINNSCASVPVAIDIAIRLINDQPDKVAIVTSSSIFNEIYRDNNRGNCANGVGAVIITNSGCGLKILKIRHRSNAKYFGLKTIEPMAGKILKLTFNEKKDSLNWEQYRQASIDFPVSILKDVLDEIGWTISDINHWVLHSSKLTKQWCSVLGIDASVFAPNMGSLTAMAKLYELFKSETVIAGDKIAVLEIGLGMSVSVMLLQNGDNLWTG